MNPFEPRRAPSEDDVMMEDEAEAQRDALLFGQQVEPRRRKTSKQPETSKLAGFASAARAAAITGAVVLAALSLSVAFYYRTDLTAANLLRVGVGDAKNAPATSAAVAAVAPAAGTTMPPPLMTASAADATTTTTPLVPPLKAAAPGASSGLVQAGLKTPLTAPGAYIAPPAATATATATTTTAADVTTTATTSTATTSTTTTASASSGKTKAVKDSRLALLPDLDDPEGLHNYVLANYYLYHGLLGEQGSSKVASPKAMNYEGKEPETEKGAREAPRTEVSGEQHLFVQAYSDPNCLESSSYGFMSFKLNTCTPAWMFSYESQKLYLKNTAYQKESLIFTATDLFSDDACTSPVTTRPVNQTNNQACNAWSSEGHVFAKFSLLPSINLKNLGPGTLIRGHADKDCSESPAETIFMTSTTGSCQGKFEAMCGATDVSLSRYEDYSCQGGREPGFPMDFTTTCSYANSLGFSKYGTAGCTSSDDSTSSGIVLEEGTGASVVDLETALAKMQKKVKEGTGSEETIAGLEQRLAALKALQDAADAAAAAAASAPAEAAVEEAAEAVMTSSKAEKKAAKAAAKAAKKEAKAEAKEEKKESMKESKGAKKL